MFCKNCNSELPDGSTFCTNCGAQLQEEATAFCTNCGSEVPAGASDCPSCGQAMSAPERKLPIPKNVLAIGVTAVAAVLVIVLLVSIFSAIFGSAMPQEAIEKLIDKGNFTIEFEAAGEDGVCMVDMDVKKHELTVYIEVGDSETAIYDGYLIQGYDGEYYAEDISDQLDLIFDAYQSFNKENWEDLFELVEDEADIDLTDYISVKGFKKGMDTFQKNMENKKWLEENADYSVETKKGVKLHTYEPNLYDFAVAALESFEKAFEDEDDYEDLQDALKTVKSYIKAFDASVTIGVKGSKLASIELEVLGSEAELTFTDIGKTKIDTDQLEDMLDDAE